MAAGGAAAVLLPLKGERSPTHRAPACLSISAVSSAQPLSSFHQEEVVRQCILRPCCTWEFFAIIGLLPTGGDISTQPLCVLLPSGGCGSSVHLAPSFHQEVIGNKCPPSVRRCSDSPSACLTCSKLRKIQKKGQKIQEKTENSENSDNEAGTQTQKIQKIQKKSDNSEKSENSENSENTYSSENSSKSEDSKSQTIQRSKHAS